MKHSELRKKALENPQVVKEYASLLPEYSLLKRMLKARKKAGLTQADVAKKMGTKAPAVVRLERSLTTGVHSPSIQTIRKYAEAVNCHLEIKLVANH